MRKLIDSGTEMERLAAYSRALVDGDWVFVSGTIGLDPATGTLASSAREQTEVAFRVIEAALATAKADLSDVVRCRVFVTRREDLPAVTEILRQTFSTVRPANTTIICQLPHSDALVEIEVTARRRPSSEVTPSV